MPESWCSLPLARHVPVKERLWPEGCGCAAVMSCGGVWIRPATASVRTEPYPLWPFAKPSAERVRRNCGGCERIALGPYGPYKSSYTRSARPGGPYLLRGTSSLIITRYRKLRGEIQRLVQRSRYPSVDTTDIAVRGRETRRRRQFPHGAGRKTAAWWKLGTSWPLHGFPTARAWAFRLSAAPRLCLTLDGTGRPISTATAAPSTRGWSRSAPSVHSSVSSADCVHCHATCHDSDSGA